MHTVLVVDDETDILELVAFNLERQELKVLTAENGLTALEMAREHVPDLIILDLMLPGRDGIDPRYLRSLAEHDATQQVSPLTALMHDRPPSSIEEECELMDLDLCAYPLEWLARVPSWR